MVIKYDKLDKHDRAVIWKQFFDKLEDEREDFTVAERAKDYVLKDEIICEVEWNGREIRNSKFFEPRGLQGVRAYTHRNPTVFQTAVALAEFRCTQDPTKDHPTLEKKDFEQVCLMTRQFKQYLEELHGANEDNRAYIWGARAALSSGGMEKGTDQHIYIPKARMP